MEKRTPARRTPRAAKAAAAPLDAPEKALARRGDDELDFLGSRARATPQSAATARVELRGLRGRLEALTRHEGRELHEVGTALNTLYMRHADAALGYPSFRALLQAELAADPRRGYEAMIVARVATADLAAAKGARWVLRAASWALLQGHAELGPALDLPVARAEGPPVPLRDATIRQIDEAIGRRSLEAPDDAPGRRVHRARERVRDLAARDAAVAALRPSVYVEDGEMVVRTVARGPESAAALRRLCAAVWGSR